MSKRILALILVIVPLAIVTVIDGFFPDHHHVTFRWHTWTAFDAGFGFVGCLALIIVSLGLGKFVLWRNTWSVLLEETAVGHWTHNAKIAKWLVREGETVQRYQGLVQVETERGKQITIQSKYPGRLAQRFIDEGGTARIGETLANLRISGKTAKQIHHEEEQHG